VPTTPDGPYPQSLLCPQRGRAPTKINIRSINSTVLSMVSSLMYVVLKYSLKTREVLIMAPRLSYDSLSITMGD
jgi:hypothetical protein